MKSNYTMILANLLFAGAVATGALMPLGGSLAAEDLPPREMAVYSRYLPGIIQDKLTTAGRESGIALLSVASAAQETLPSLEEYLGKLVCTGCDRRCPLTALKCSRGQPYLQKATGAYTAMAAKASAPADNVVLEKPQAEKTVKAIDPVEQKVVQDEKKVGVVDEKKSKAVETTMEYLPLAGMVVGGVYFAVGNKKKIKEKEER